MTRQLMAVALISAAACATPAAAAPLGAPMPTKLTLDSMLSTTARGGDAQGVLPGARACESARHDPLSLPADDAAHPDVELEWWWWNGHLETSDGRRFGFIVYFLSRPALGLATADISLIDEQTGRFHYFREPLVRGSVPSLPARFELQARSTTARGGDGRDRLHSELDGFALDLESVAVKPPIPQFGDEGYGTVWCNSAYFYSRVLSYSGTLLERGKPLHVTGRGRFEHQWGFLPWLAPASWNHISLSLDDGRDIFVARMRGLNTELATLALGTVSDADGRVTQLHASDFDITPTRYWRRDATCSYPVEFDVRVKDERFHVRAVMDDQELHATRSPADLALWPENPIYWDGATIVSGAEAGRGWLDTAKVCAI